MRRTSSKCPPGLEQSSTASFDSNEKTISITDDEHGGFIDHRSFLRHGGKVVQRGNRSKRADLSTATRLLRDNATSPSSSIEVCDPSSRTLSWQDEVEAEVKKDKNRSFSRTSLQISSNCINVFSSKRKTSVLQQVNQEESIRGSKGRDSRESSNASNHCRSLLHPQYAKDAMCKRSKRGENSRQSLLSSTPPKTNLSLARQNEKEEIVKQEQRALDASIPNAEKKPSMTNALFELALNIMNITFLQGCFFVVALSVATCTWRFLRVIPIGIVYRVTSIVLRWLRYVKEAKKAELNNLKKDSISFRVFATSEFHKVVDQNTYEQKKRIILAAVARAVLIKKKKAKKS